MLMGAAGAGGAEPQPIQNIFRQYSYIGNRQSRNFNTGIDLLTDGGMLWYKRLHGDNASGGNVLSLPHIQNNMWYPTSYQGSYSNTNHKFTNNANPRQTHVDGFEVSSSWEANSNYQSNQLYGVDLWKNSPRFFQAFAYSGNSSNQTINHGLGVEPGMIMLYMTTYKYHWAVWHKDLPNTSTNYLRMGEGSTYGEGGVATQNDLMTSAVTANTFTLGNHIWNMSGRDYIAIVFAHDPAGENNDNGGRIACGKYVGGNYGVTVNLGWEPQYLLVRNTGSGHAWKCHRSLQGWVNDSTTALSRVTHWHEGGQADTPERSNVIQTTATGFYILPESQQQGNNKTDYSESGEDHIYMAVRAMPQGDDFVPDQLFSATTGNGSSSYAYSKPGWYSADYGTQSSNTSTYKKPMVDMALDVNLGGGSTDDVTFYCRKIQERYREMHQTGAFYSWTDANFWLPDGFRIAPTNGSTDLGLMWSRAPEFFDVQTWRGDGTSNRTISHGLQGQVDMIWTRIWDNTSYGWHVYARALGANKYLKLTDQDEAKTDTGVWGNTHPTNSVFTAGDYNTNYSGYQHLALLFGSRSGISKIGTFSGNGSSQTIDCGFTNGIRFLMLKNTDYSSTHWLFFDEQSGCTNAGNDPFFRLISQTGSTTNQDIIDPASSGFVVNVNSTYRINQSGHTNLYYAIAA